MKIIDNKKDYYDYVVGEYGIDDLIMFDRRQSIVVHTDRLVGNINDYIFNNAKQAKDDYRKKVRDYWLAGKKYRDEGSFYPFVLKAGAMLYYFEVERFLTDAETVNKVTKLAKTEKVSNKTPYSDVILGIFPLKDKSYISNSYIFKECWILKQDITLLPILKNTEIPSMIPAKEIYQNIYDFISSQKDIKIEDNRNDVLKLESAGFDKKESFRNIK